MEYIKSTDLNMSMRARMFIREKQCVWKQRCFRTLFAWIDMRPNIVWSVIFVWNNRIYHMPWYIDNDKFNSAYREPYWHQFYLVVMCPMWIDRFRRATTKLRAELFGIYRFYPLRVINSIAQEKPIQINRCGGICVSVGVGCVFWPVDIGFKRTMYCCFTTWFGYCVIHIAYTIPCGWTHKIKPRPSTLALFILENESKWLCCTPFTTCYPHRHCEFIDRLIYWSEFNVIADLDADVLSIQSVLCNYIGYTKYWSEAKNCSMRFSPEFIR